MSRRREIRLAACGCLLLLGAGCEGGARDAPKPPAGGPPVPAARGSEPREGGNATDRSASTSEESARPVPEGQTWYRSYNCAGCHGAGGGGGIGPPLNDGEWIYGSEPEHILASVIEGRPNGMPSFRGKIEDVRLRQLVAFVRSLGGLPPKDGWPVGTDQVPASRE